MASPHMLSFVWSRVECDDGILAEQSVLVNFCVVRLRIDVVTQLLLMFVGAEIEAALRLVAVVNVVRHETRVIVRDDRGVFTEAQTGRQATNDPRTQQNVALLYRR